MKKSLLTISLVLLVSLSGCSVFNPHPGPAEPTTQELQTAINTYETANSLTVTRDTAQALSIQSNETQARMSMNSHIVSEYNITAQNYKETRSIQRNAESSTIPELNKSSTTNQTIYLIN